MGIRVKAPPASPLPPSLPEINPSSNLHLVLQTTIEGVQYQGAINVRADQVVPDEKPSKGDFLITIIIPLVMLIMC